ncbi:hypothetical protein YC2023_023611 [Brassica napus]
MFSDLLYSECVPCEGCTLGFFPLKLFKRGLARPGHESDSDPGDLEHAEKLRQVKAVREEVF